MLGIFITLVLLSLVGVTIYLLSHQHSKFANNSVFTDQYNQLVHLLINKRKFDILKVKNHSMAIRIHLHRDNHVFTLSHLDERLHVEWKLQSHLFGKHGKDWSFNPAFDQNKMYEEILTDIRNYMKALRSDKQYIDQSFLTVV